MQKRRSYKITRGTTLFDNKCYPLCPCRIQHSFLITEETRFRLLENRSPELLGGGVIIQNRRCLSPADSSL